MKPARREPPMSSVTWTMSSKEGPVRSSDVEEGAAFDVAVIGGGFCGLTCALQAASSGVSVALFEATEIGGGASGRTGALVVPHFPGGMNLSDVRALLGAKKADALGELVATGSQKVFDQIRKHQINCDAEQNGWVQPAHSQNSLPKVRKVYDDWKAFGVDVEWLDRDQVAETLGTACHLGGWRNAEGGILNPFALCRGLARAAIAQGAVVYENSPVTGFARDQHGTLLSVGGITVRAKKVLIATNGYTGPALGGLDSTVIPVRLWHTFTRPLSPELQEQILPNRICFTDIRRSGGFCRYSADNRIFSGGAVFALGDPTQAGIRHSQERLKHFFPQLAEPEIEHYWEGYCALTTSMLPSLQVVDKDILAVVGFSTRGVALAQNIGRLAGNLLAEKMDLDAFPLAVHEPRPIAWQRLKTFLGAYAFPVYKAMDRWGVT